MKSFIASITLLALTSIAVAGSIQDGFIPESIKKAVTQQVIVKGCNANVCFAIDGSNAVGADNYKRSVNFVMNVIDIVGADERAEFAATQFYISNKVIAPLTGLRDQTLLKLNASTALGGDVSNIGAGIVYCDFQLGRRPLEANKMVVITDGDSNFGGNPVDRADRYRGRNPKNEICTVGVGNQKDDVLRQISGGLPIFSVRDYFELALRVDSLVSEICNFNI